jgi:hypothetical protein
MPHGTVKKSTTKKHRHFDLNHSDGRIITLLPAQVGVQLGHFYRTRLFNIDHIAIQ